MIDGGVIAIIFIALVILILILIVSLVVRKKKRDRELLPTAIEWVDQAKAKRGTYDQIKAELKAKGWSRKIIKKALKVNGLVK